KHKDERKTRRQVVIETVREHRKAYDVSDRSDVHQLLSSKSVDQVDPNQCCKKVYNTQRNRPHQRLRGSETCVLQNLRSVEQNDTDTRELIKECHEERQPQYPAVLPRKQGSRAGLPILALRLNRLYQIFHLVF